MRVPTCDLICLVSQPGHDRLTTTLKTESGYDEIDRRSQTTNPGCSPQQTSFSSTVISGVREPLSAPGRWGGLGVDQGAVRIMQLGIPPTGRLVELDRHYRARSPERLLVWSRHGMI